MGLDAGLQEVLQTIKDAKTEEEREAVFKQATHSPYFYFTATQAQMFYTVCIHDIRMDKIKAIVSLLPQIVNAEEAVKFVDQNLNDEEKLELRVKIGSVYNIYLGVYTGHYCWNLQKEQGKILHSYLSVCTTYTTFFGRKSLTQTASQTYY